MDSRWEHNKQILGFSAFRTGRKKFLSFKTHRLWHFCYGSLELTNTVIYGLPCRMPSCCFGPVRSQSRYQKRKEDTGVFILRDPSRNQKRKE